MADSPRRRPSSASPNKGRPRSPSPLGSPSRSRARARSKSRSRSRSRSGSRGRNETLNPGNTLYVTGLSTRVTERDLEDHFSKEGKVARCFLVVEPRTRISRGFAFVTMDTVEDADLCVKYLNQSVLQGRYITVEKSRRKRPRTPTPGNYLGLKSTRETSFRHDRGRPRGGGGRDEFGGGGSYQRRSPYRGGRDYSPRRSPYYGGGGGGGGGGGWDKNNTARVIGNLALAIGLTYLTVTGQLGWLLDAIVSIWLLAVLLPILGLGAFFWFAGQDIIQDSCPNCGNEFQIFKSSLKDGVQFCPFCAQPISVQGNKFVKEPARFSSNRSSRFREASSGGSPRRSEKGKGSSAVIVDIEAEVTDAD